MTLDWEGTNKKHTLTAHRKYWANLLEEWELTIPTSDKCYEKIQERQFNINIDSFAGKLRHISKTQINVYTDGSKTEHGVGAGFVVYKKGKKITEDAIPMEKDNTVFQAEVEAINQATKKLNLLNTKGDMKYIKIFCDSQAAILAIKNNVTSSTLVREAIRGLNTLAANSRRVTLTWIKAHVGHDGNEEADALARHATTLICLQPYPYLPHEIKK